ncbi:hypothetical protein KDA08_05785 [Candidatus Saccharibacteria bacterium]|nr:hypothetical protein [Candidatus Saccharibacteria bacterium]
MFQTPDRLSLAALDLIGVLLFTIQALVLLAVWLKTNRQDKFALWLAGMYTFLALRLITGVYIRVLNFWGIAQGPYESSWLWLAFITGLALNLSGLPVLWVYLGDSVKVAIRQFFKRVIKGLE